MELVGSLPCLQVPVTCPYPEADQSSPYPQTQLPEDPSEYDLPVYAWVFLVVSFPQVSPPKPCVPLSCLQYVLHAPPISLLFLNEAAVKM